MRAIYEPQGAAREYAELAFNSYIGCPHGCKYCFAPSVMRKDRESYHHAITPRSGKVIADFAKDCEELKRSGDTRRVHLNFISDPYPDCEADLHVTRRCIEAAAENGIGINILTKGKYETVRPDFELFKRAGVHFGITCSFFYEAGRREWEPFASSVGDRVALLRDAHDMGIYTWVSMEPVIDPDEALLFFKLYNGIVDLWKVGKLNYHAHAKSVDWVKFREDFRSAADRRGANYIVKKSLMEAR